MIARPRSFVYLATKTGGGKTFGVRHAASARVLAAELRRERQVLLNAWALPGGGGSSGPAKLPLKDESELNTQIAQLVSRGVPLVEALAVARGVVSEPSRPIVDKMRELVQAGDGFADACAKIGCFDVVATSVYRAAERTGDLAGACQQLSQTAKRRLQIASKVISALIYPVLVGFIGVLAGVFMLVFVVPRVGDAMREAFGDKPLPWYTQITLSAGELLQTQWMIAVVVVALVAGGAWVFRERVLKALMSLGRFLPMVNGLLGAQERARFLTVMASMTASGVPLADALTISAPTVDDPVFRKQLTKLRNRLVEGGVFPRLIEDVTSMPEATRRLLVAADRAGDLESAFEALADDASEEVSTKSERLVSVIEPLMIVLLFLVIGTIVLSIMIPLLTLPSQIQG